MIKWYGDRHGQVTHGDMSDKLEEDEETDQSSCSVSETKQKTGKIQPKTWRFMLISHGSKPYFTIC